MVISENDAIPRMIWGLDEQQQNEERTPSVITHDASHGKECTCDVGFNTTTDSVTAGPFFVPPQVGKGRAYNRCLTSTGKSKIGGSGPIGTFREPVVFGNNTAHAHRMVHVDTERSMGRIAAPSRNDVFGTSASGRDYGHPLSEDTVKWSTQPGRASTRDRSRISDSNNRYQTPRQHAHFQHHRQPASLELPAHNFVQHHPSSYPDGSRLNTLLELLAATTPVQAISSSYSQPYANTNALQSGAIPLPHRRPLSVSSKPAVQSQTECLLDMPNEPLLTPPSSTSPLFPHAFSSNRSMVPSLEFSSFNPASHPLMDPSHVPPRPRSSSEPDVGGRRSNLSELLAKISDSIHQSRNSISPQTSPVVSSFNGLTPPPGLAPRPSTNRTGGPAGPRPAAKGLSHPRSIPISRLRQKLAPVPEEDGEPRQHSRTPSPFVRAPLLPPLKVNAEPKPEEVARGSVGPSVQGKQPLGETTNGTPYVSGGVKKNGNGSRGTKKPQGSRKRSSKAENAPVSSAAGSSVLSEKENVSVTA